MTTNRDAYAMYLQGRDINLCTVGDGMSRDDGLCLVAMVLTPMSPGYAAALSLIAFVGIAMPLYSLATDTLLPLTHSGPALPNIKHGSLQVHGWPAR